MTGLWFKRLSPRRRWWRRAILWVALIGLLSFVAIEGAIRSVRLPQSLFLNQSPHTEFLDRNGRSLRLLPQADRYQQEPLSLADYPDVLIQATLAAEDKRFFQHEGIDTRAIARAGWGLVRNGRIVSGASTISQQLIKRAQPRPRTWRVKLEEALQAMKLERQWSKQQILTAYLNQLDYGNQCFGSHSAAQFYLGKDLRDLSLAEAAFLAGLPQSPSRLNPRRNPERAEKRRQWILRRMNDEKMISTAEYERARHEVLHLSSLSRTFRAPHFVEFLLQQESIAARSPGKIQTTLDLGIYDMALRVLRERLQKIKSNRVPSGAVIVLENQTGHVLAMVGHENYFSPAGGQVNAALALRSPGSTIKPFTYWLALEKGWTPASLLADVPTEFQTETGVYHPLNYDKVFRGPVLLRHALGNSLNVPAARLLDALGGPRPLHDRLREVGITSLRPDFAEYGVGLTLGNGEVSLLELVNAYAVLARLGVHRDWQVVPGLPTKPRRVGDSTACFLVADILADNNARRQAFGSNSDLKFDFPVACKTGTSSNYRDNWAIGFTPEFTVGVWVGHLDGSPMEELPAVVGAAPVLKKIMEQLHVTHGTSWFSEPPGVATLPIDPFVGKGLSASQTPAILEKFDRRHPPALFSSTDLDDQGRRWLGAEFQSWWEAAGREGQERFAVRPAETSQVSIRTPRPGSTFFLDGDLPDSGSQLPLEVEGQAEVRWESASLRCFEHEGKSFARMQVGRHELVVTDLRTGRKQSTWIEVKNL